MPNYEHDKVVPYAGSQQSKKEQVASMFDQISGRYDLLNRILSGGIDKGWRKKALRELKANQPKTLLDIATGTADVALMATKELKSLEHITGIDISAGMLDYGRIKIAAKGLERKINLQIADSASIPADTNSFDAATVAFGVRNFEKLEAGLQEILRVLKPGGKLVVLEFSRPKNILVQFVYKLYMRFITPSIGKWVSKNRDAYAYLDESIRKFPEGAQFIDILNRTGYQHPYLKTLSFGICTIYCATK
jgi:demethylmenaquinone methyltransferase/2-methoxy-6-polyprenyl-1,4-benzoquinol methylase